MKYLILLAALALNGCAVLDHIAAHDAAYGYGFTDSNGFANSRMYSAINDPIDPCVTWLDKKLVEHRECDLDKIPKSYDIDLYDSQGNEIGHANYD